MSNICWARIRNNIQATIQPTNKPAQQAFIDGEYKLKMPILFCGRQQHIITARSTRSYQEVRQKPKTQINDTKRNR